MNKPGLAANLRHVVVMPRLHALRKRGEACASIIVTGFTLSQTDLAGSHCTTSVHNNQQTQKPAIMRRISAALALVTATALVAPPRIRKSIPLRAVQDIEPEPLGPANAAAGAVFAGLVAWSFGFAPGELGNPADNALIELLVTQPVPRPESVNELWFAVWNCFAVVPVVIAALTLPAASRGQRLPAAPFLVGSGAFGFFALGPYFAARSARTDSVIDPEEFGFFTKNVFETRALGVAMAALAASIPFSSDLLTADPATVISGFQDLAASSRFVAVASADIGIMSVLAAFLVGEDSARRGWGEYRIPLAAASLLLPVLGPSLYLAARPLIE